LSLVSGSLVFQFLCTSPEALLNLKITFVIIIYSLVLPQYLEQSSSVSARYCTRKASNNSPAKIPGLSVAWPLQVTLVS